MMTISIFRPCSGVYPVLAQNFGCKGAVVEGASEETAEEVVVDSEETTESVAEKTEEETEE